MENKITITKEGETNEEVLIAENLKGRYKSGVIVQELLNDLIQIIPLRRGHKNSSYSVHDTLAIVWNKKLSKRKLKQELNKFLEELENDY